jgi:hypothetical protein
MLFAMAALSLISEPVSGGGGDDVAAVEGATFDADAGADDGTVEVSMPAAPPNHEET